MPNTSRGSSGRDGGGAFEAAAGLGSLAGRSVGPIRVAVDTEFDGPHTLTAQFAVRDGDAVVVQLYYSPSIGAAVASTRHSSVERKLRRASRRLGVRLVVRPPKVLTSGLSPARVLADLLGLRGLEVVERLGFGAQPRAVHVVFIGHFLAADFFRMFGREFFEGLVRRQTAERDIVLRSNRLLGFRRVGTGGRFSPPVLDRAVHGGAGVEVRVSTLDTLLPYGPASLDTHALTFLGVGKLNNVSAADKRDMLGAFRRDAPGALAYAVMDAVVTLLVEEKMRREHAATYRELGVADAPAMQATLGTRVAELLARACAATASGSELLSRPGRGGGISLSKVRRLMAGGSGDHLVRKGYSRFGSQTAETHGGLLYSRTPTRFFSAADGNLRDADLSGCYANVVAGMSVYFGEPVVYEPGAERKTLAEVAAFLLANAAGRDAWVVKVSGPVPAGTNALIPSTSSALTHANYRSRRARARAGSRRKGFTFDWLFEQGKDSGNACLFTDVVEAGFVAWPTWLMIQAMPECLRRQYEALEVETVLFYPGALAAASGGDYDSLARRLSGPGVGWSSVLDIGGLRRVVTEQIGADNVSLRFEIGRLAARITENRAEARRRHGRGSGAELAWKVTGNCLYGALTSRHLVANNVVAANYVTATARALAFAMQMSLNGFQVITDGVTYRVDQIPAGTFAELLASDPSYPLNRDGVPTAFLPAGGVPRDDEGFTAWYREHVKRFFGVGGPDYDRLFGAHAVEHKRCGPPGGERGDFDALCCDGSGNYVKLFRAADGWRVAGRDGFKARGYRDSAKEALAPWIIRTYSGDDYASPPPLTTSASVIKYKEAGRLARRALDGLVAERGADPEPRVYYPLGLEGRQPRSYKVIKPSAFLFRTPEQREKFVKAAEKFAEQTACGFELLALRRSAPGRRRGSLRDLAREFYDYIREGRDDFARSFNLTRDFEGRSLGERLADELRRLKAEENARLFSDIDEAGISGDARLTGWYVSRVELIVADGATDRRAE